MQIENYKWFLVYTKAREEERAKKNLENQGVETFLPMIDSETINQPKLLSFNPMFPRYLFIKINAKNNNWAHIKSTRGVSHLVVFGDKLAEVPSLVVEFLKIRVDDQDRVRQKVIRQEFQKGDKLVIKKGVMQGKEASFLSKAGTERVKILFKLMNELVIVELPGQDVGYKTIIEAFKL
jgi:transcriptional antiterminator RfaH